MKTAAWQFDFADSLDPLSYADILLSAKKRNLGFAISSEFNRRWNSQSKIVKQWNILMWYEKINSTSRLYTKTFQRLRGVILISNP